MRSRYQLIEDDDPYGPGADLLISLFAMAVLMVGLIGAGDVVQRGTDAAHAHVSPGSVLPPSAVATQTAELEVQLQEAATLQQSTQKKLDDTKRDVADLRSIIARYKTALQQKGEVRIEIADLTGESGPLFETCAGSSIAQYACSLRPSQRLIDAIVAGLRQKAGDLQAVQANQLVIEVWGLTSAFESPVSRQQEGQLDLSADRAVGIVHALAERGLPYMCMVPIGLGRSRSPVLRSQIDRGLEALKSWDGIVKNPENAKLLNHPGDLRVIAYTREDDIDNVCPSASFSRALIGIRG